MIVVPAKLATIVARADAQSTALGAQFDDRGKPRSHRLSDSLAGEAVLRRAIVSHTPYLFLHSASPD